MILYLLYNLFLHLTIIILSPVLLVFLLFDRYDMRQRLGFRKFTTDNVLENVIWFHAASMGEVTALATVIDEVHRTYPQLNVAVSTTTTSGRDRARELIPSANSIFIAPLDVPWAIKSTLRRLRPSALIITETELWPNTIRLVKDCGCTIALINGRLSHKSTKRYRLVKGFIQTLLKSFDLLCVQTEIDRDRFIALGAEPKHTIVLGNLKVDLHRFHTSQKRSTFTRDDFGLPTDANIIVAGSTRPGEEEMLISGFHLIKAAVPSTVLIIAPRHLDRIPDVEQMLTGEGLRFKRRSRIDSSAPNDASILLLDTMGELSDIYALADLAFVGGSLVSLGGHNPLEPAMWGVPVLFGPHRDNVRQQTNWLIREGGGIEILDGNTLAETVIRLLEHPDELNARGKAALKVVESKTGVSTRTVQLLRTYGIL